MLVKLDDGLMVNPKLVTSVWANHDGRVEITMKNGDVFTVNDEGFDEVAAKLTGEGK